MKKECNCFISPFICANCKLCDYMDEEFNKDITWAHI